MIFPNMLLLPHRFPEGEVHIHDNGTACLVTHLEVQHQFVTLAGAMMCAHYLRGQHRGEDRLRIVLHRADSPLAN